MTDATEVLTRLCHALDAALEAGKRADPPDPRYCAALELALRLVKAEMRQAESITGDDLILQAASRYGWSWDETVKRMRKAVKGKA